MFMIKLNKLTFGKANKTMAQMECAHKANLKTQANQGFPMNDKHLP